MGHDLAIGCSSVEEFLARLDGVEGSVETGAVLGWRLLKKLRPSMRQIVISRPFREILRSLDRAGFPYDRNELIERQALLDMAKSNASMAMTFEQLEDREERRILWEYLIDSEWDEEWDRRVSETKIEVEPKTRLALLAANRARTEELKRDLAQLLAAMGLEVTVAPSRSCAITT